jgi:bacteriophage Mu I protein GP32
MTKSPIACSFKLAEANGHIQLFPFGRFYPADGRTEGVGGWYVDDSNGYALAESINQLGIELMIDYEHQTLYLEKNGQGNPAAGWIKQVEYRPNEGLFATVAWTEKAASQIKAGEYRYISPLFIPDSNGRVVQVLNAALTNRPALHNLAEAFALSHTFNQQKQGQPMLKLLQQLFDAPNASEAEIMEKLTALSAAKGDAKVALSAVYDELKTQTAQAVALSAQVANPDPTKFVALSHMQAVQTELNALKAQHAKEKADSLITQALSDGRLLPAQKAWAENLAQTNFVALSDYLATVTPNAALAGGMQAKDEPVDKPVALSAEELAAAKMLGMSEAEFMTAHKEGK